MRLPKASASERRTPRVLTTRAKRNRAIREISRNDALRHRGPRHRSGAVMSSHLTVGVRAAFELHSSRRRVQPSLRKPYGFQRCRLEAVPTGEAHRLPKKCAGFIGGTGGSQGRPQQKRGLPQSLRRQRACGEMVIVRAIARKRRPGARPRSRTEGAGGPRRCRLGLIGCDMKQAHATHDAQPAIAFIIMPFLHPRAPARSLRPSRAAASHAR